MKETLRKELRQEPGGALGVGSWIDSRHSMLVWKKRRIEHQSSPSWTAAREPNPGVMSGSSRRAGATRTDRHAPRQTSASR